MNRYGFATNEFVASEAQRENIPELQAFTESNSEYWLLTHGHPAAPDDAARSFEWQPPPDMTYSEHLQLLVRDASSREMLGQIDVATDLMATGVYHLGFFLTATRTHGTGFAHRLYQAYEHWAVKRGARWLRLGVVEVNRRAAAFWRRHGYIEQRRQSDYMLGDVRHVLIKMVKPMAGETLDDYLDAVPSDRRDP